MPDAGGCCSTCTDLRSGSPLASAMALPRKTVWQPHGDPVPYRSRWVVRATAFVPDAGTPSTSPPSFAGAR